MEVWLGPSQAFYTIFCALLLSLLRYELTFCLLRKNASLLFYPNFPTPHCRSLLCAEQPLHHVGGAFPGPCGCGCTHDAKVFWLEVALPMHDIVSLVLEEYKDMPSISDHVLLLSGYRCSGIALTLFMWLLLHCSVRMRWFAGRNVFPRNSRTSIFLPIIVY